MYLHSTILSKKAVWYQFNIKTFMCTQKEMNTPKY